MDYLSLTRYLKRKQDSNEKLFKKRNSKMSYKSHTNLFEKLTNIYTLQLKINLQVTYKTYAREK